MSFLKQFSLFSVSEILSIGIGIIVSPIVTRLLTMEQYGAVPVLNAIWSVFALIQYGGMDWAFPFFISHPELWNLRKVQTTSTYIVIFSSTLVWLIFSIWLFISKFGYTNAKMTFIEQLFYIATILPSALIGWQLYMLRFMLQALNFAKISIFSRILPPIIIIPFMAIASQENRLAINLFISLISLWVVCLWGVNILKRSKIDLNYSYFSWELAKKLLQYGLVLVPGGVIYSLFTIVDQFLISTYLDSKEMALFKLAISIGGVALLIKVWFGRIFDPYMVRWISTKQPELYIPKLQNTLNLMALIMSYISLVALFLSKHIIYFLYPKSYYNCAEIIPLIVLSGAISTLSLIVVASPLISQKKYFHIPVYSVGLIINFIIGLTLIPKIGVSGAVWGSFFGEVAILSLWLIIDYRILKNLNLNIKFSLLIFSVPTILSIFYKSQLYLKGSLIESIILTLIFSLIWIFIFKMRFKNELESLSKKIGVR